MHEQIQNLLNQFEFNSPTSIMDIKKVEKVLNIKFPSEYIEFLLYSNGGAGGIGTSYLSLWKLEDIIELNEAYEINEFAPGLLIIGSDGGDTAYCIDLRNENKLIVSVPFIGMDLTEVKYCSDSFYGFIRFLNKN